MLSYVSVKRTVWGVLETWTQHKGIWVTYSKTKLQCSHCRQTKELTQCPPLFSSHIQFTAWHVLCCKLLWKIHSKQGVPGLVFRFQEGFNDVCFVSACLRRLPLRSHTEYRLWSQLPPRETAALWVYFQWEKETERLNQIKSDFKNCTVCDEMASNDNNKHFMVLFRWFFFLI